MLRKVNAFLLRARSSSLKLEHKDDCNCVGPVLCMKPTLSKPAFAANSGSNDPSLMLRHREFPSATSFNQTKQKKISFGIFFFPSKKL